MFLLTKWCKSFSKYVTRNIQEAQMVASTSTHTTESSDASCASSELPEARDAVSASRQLSCTSRRSRSYQLSHFPDSNKFIGLQRQCNWRYVDEPISSSSSTHSRDMQSVSCCSLCSKESGSTLCPHRSENGRNPRQDKVLGDCGHTRSGTELWIRRADVEQSL